MNKQEFLKELKQNLRGFSQEEIDDILYDYEEHFSIGLSSGKTEEEIAEDLGNPKDIAQQYKKAKGNPTIEETAKYYKEKAREKTKAFSRSMSDNKNKSDRFMKIAIFILLAVILSPIILGVAGTILSTFVGGIGLIFGSAIGMISCVAVAATTPSNLTALFFGVIWILVSLIFFGILMTILGYYGIKFCILLVKKAMEYLTGEPPLKDKKSFWSKKGIVAIIVSLVVAIATFSIGLFQTISSGLSIGSDLAPQVGSYLNEFGDDSFFDLNFLGTNRNINITKTENLDNVNSLNINSVISDVDIVKSNDNMIKVELNGDYKSNDNSRLIDLSLVKNNNDILVKEINTPHNISYNDLHLVIYIPDNYKGDISVSSVAGDIKSDKILELNSLKADSVSGDVEFSSVSAPIVDVNSTSGEIKFNNLNTNSSALKSVSGDINVDSYVGSLTAESKSGSVDFNISEIKGPSTINTISGDIDISLGISNDLVLDGKTISGNISVSNDLNNQTIETGDKFLKATFNDGKNKLNITTTSGNIELDN